MTQYNRNQVLKYAMAWAFTRNPRYMDFTTLGGDCTNFVSQCLVAGGLPQNYAKDTGWYYKSPTDRAAAFSGVEYLYNYLTKNKIATEAPVESLEIGDIIQLSFDGEKFVHSLIVVEAGTNPKIATHTMDSFGRPISSYGYITARGLHILDR